jgi:hypothetical protein
MSPHWATAIRSPTDHIEIVAVTIVKLRNSQQLKFGFMEPSFSVSDPRWCVCALKEREVLCAMKQTAFHVEQADISRHFQTRDGRPFPQLRLRKMVNRGNLKDRPA